MFCEKTYFENCYAILSALIDLDDIDDMKPVITRYLDETYAEFTADDFKNLVEVCYTTEQLGQYETLTEDLYVELATNMQSIFAGKILNGYIDICSSECDTVNHENVDDLDEDDFLFPDF